MAFKALATTLTILLLTGSTFASDWGNERMVSSKEQSFEKLSSYALNFAKKKKKPTRKGYDGSGFALKAMPALFWNSFSIEAEYPASRKFSIALSTIFKLGRTDGQRSNFKVNPADYLDNGFRVELQVRYFLNGFAPLGFYVSAFASYGQIVYFDGTTRPYSLWNRVKEQDNLRNRSGITKPQPIGGGAGLGYQLMIIPKRIVANFFIGVQTNVDGDNTIFLSGYVAPSIGIIL
jgi:hypothetical protein